MGVTKKSIVVHATAPGNKSISYTIPYVKKTITDSDALDFAVAINNLTQNSFVTAETILYTDISDAEGE